MSTSHKQTSDIFLVSLPWWDNHLPPCAPAVLKGIVESQGFKMKTYDSNIDLQWEICGNDIDLYNNLFSYFFLTQENYQHQNLIEKFYDLVVDKIQKQDTRFLAFSVFSVYTHKAVLDILKCLQKINDIPPIVLGGRGLNTRSNLSILDELTASEKLLNFSDIIRRRNLADHIIIGDGEDALVNLLNGGRPDLGNIHHVASSAGLDYPFSNFDDMDLDKYNEIGGVKQLPVVSSKGCVRACDFCDVAAQMVKFQSKDGVRLAEEVIYLSNRYGVLEFAMSDSIANGNMKSLTKFCEKMAEYNAKVSSDKKISWAGNWISRPPGAIKPHFYDLLAASGCASLTIGAEHASNKVLESMQKKTVVEGISFDLEQFNRVGVSSALNIITGHWSEHFDDYMQLYDFLIKQGRYLANGTLSTFRTSTFNTLDKTPAVDHINLTGLMRADDNFTILWYTKKNPKSTVKIRLARFLTIIELYYQLQVSDSNHWNEMKILISRIEQSTDTWDEFFSKTVDPDSFEVCHESLDFMETHNSYFKDALKRFYPMMPLKLKVNAFRCNTLPRLFIKYNDKTLYDKEIDEGINEINLELINDFDRESSIEIGMTNKGPNDTIVDEKGNIIEDKKIMIESFELDTVDVFNDQRFFYHHTEYEENGEKISTSRPGFFLNNSVLRIRYWAPFWKDYLSLNTSSWFIEEEKKAEMEQLFLDLKSKIRKLKY